MPEPGHAADIYARISSDPARTGLGVQRQLEDCRALAARLGWSVVDEYVDNDVSAYFRKRRPDYERMLVDLQERRRDALIAYHVDRLYRKPIELERLLEVAAPARALIRFVTGHDLDLSNSNGLMVIRMLVAVAANESATKSRRVLGRGSITRQPAYPTPAGGTTARLGTKATRSRSVMRKRKSSGAWRSDFSPVRARVPWHGGRRLRASGRRLAAVGGLTTFGSS
jgi:site-specific DNA recombinase